VRFLQGKNKIDRVAEFFRFAPNLPAMDFDHILHKMQSMTGSLLTTDIRTSESLIKELLGFLRGKRLPCGENTELHAMDPFAEIIF